ncbi:MAG: sulfotransferase domain-containing protein [Candidatus Binataceae bacterium]
MKIPAGTFRSMIRSAVAAGVSEEARPDSARTRLASDADRKLPDFIAVGPPRTATTWLDKVLRGHVSLPRIKETDFFGANFPRGFAWYRSHFRNPPAGRPMGEVCTRYFTSPEARERIGRYIPDCKIICTLRDPVQRLHSHYRLARSMAWLGRVGIEEAVAARQGRSNPGNMITGSLYSTGVKAWQDRFGKGNVSVLLNDDLVGDEQKYLDQVCTFVGIPMIDLAHSQLRNRTVNARPNAPRSWWLARGAGMLRAFLRRHRVSALSERFQALWYFCFSGGEEFAPLDPAFEARLREYFRPDVEALEELLQRDLSAWK